MTAQKSPLKYSLLDMFYRPKSLSALPLTTFLEIPLHDFFFLSSCPWWKQGHQPIIFRSTAAKDYIVILSLGKSIKLFTVTYEAETFNQK